MFDRGKATLIPPRCPWRRPFCACPFLLPPSLFHPSLGGLTIVKSRHLRDDFTALSEENACRFGVGEVCDAVEVAWMESQREIRNQFHSCGGGGGSGGIRNQIIDSKTTVTLSLDNILSEKEHKKGEDKG